MTDVSRPVHLDVALPIVRSGSATARTYDPSDSSVDSRGLATAPTVVDGVTALRFTHEETEVLTGPIVYVWTRDERALYVGSSAQGIRRCLNRHHHKLRLEPGDRLDVYPMESVERARTVERELIACLRPPHNGPKVDRSTWSSSVLLQPAPDGGPPSALQRYLALGDGPLPSHIIAARP